MLTHKSLWLLLVVFAELVLVVSAIADWEAIEGPPVGVGTDICISLHSGTEYIYLTSGSGDFPYVSSNSGNSWDPLKTDSDAKDARCVTLNPTNKDLIYIAKHGGVFKSTNGGLVFFEVGENDITNDDVIDLEMDPSSSDTVWCVSQWAQGEDVLFRTENAGNSWSAISPPNDTAQIQTVEVDPITSDTVFLGSAAGTSDHRGVYRSTDFGSSWTQTLDSAHIYTIAVSEDSNAFVFAGGKPSSGSGGIIYKSTDNGQNWDNGTSFNGEVKAIVFDPTNYQKAYAATDSGAYKTTNGGSNWAVFEDDEDDDPYCDVFLSCAVSRADADTIYFGGKFSVYRASADDGDWDEITSGMSPGESNAVAALLPKVWVLNDTRTLHESTDGSDSWTTVSYLSQSGDKRKLIAVDPDDNNGNYTIYSSFFNCTESHNSDQIQKSTDTGRTWESVYDPQGDGAVVTCIVVDTASANNATIYATYTYQPNIPVIIKSTDSGASWDPITTGLPSGKDVYCLGIHPDSNHILYVGLEDNGVYKSTDAGSTWSWIGIYSTVKALAIAPSAPETIYAGGPLGLYVSRDGGSSWPDAHDPPVNNCVNLLAHPEVAAVAYAICVDDQGNGYVYVSLNTAHDWLDITEGLPDDWILVHNAFLDLYFANLQMDPVRTDSLFLGTAKGLYYLNTNLYYGTVSSGAVNWNDDWIFLPGDYTIGTNATLNVAAGTEVYVPRGSDSEGSGVAPSQVELIVEGEIDVNGTSGSPVEFLPAPPSPTSGAHWRGIRLRPDSDGDFDYAEMQQSYRGIEADNCDTLDIDHCKFYLHNNAGVHVNQSPPGISVSNCNFDTCGDYGIYATGGSPTIYGNGITRCAYGIYYSGTGSPVIRRNTIDFSTGTSYYGIYTKTETGTNSPAIDSCKVSGYSLYGIYMEKASSNAYVKAVTCSNNTNGMRLQSASPSMVCQAGAFNSIAYNDSWVW
jgi:parallel beta-helix repeat protein